MANRFTTLLERGQAVTADRYAAPVPTNRTAPSNLLVIIADQWRGQALGLCGTDPVHTPHVDRLATQGRVMTRAVSNQPVCSPFRAMFMSGQFPVVNGVTTNCNSRTAPLGVGLHEDLTCWPDVLNEAGYRCGYIGKWHLDAPTSADVRELPADSAGVTWDAFTPPERRHGFDFWHAYGSFNDHFHPHYWNASTPQESPLHFPGSWSPVHETDVAAEFLTEQATTDQPFALVVSYNPPHTPFHLVPEEFREPYRDIDPRELLNRPNVSFDSPAGQVALDGVADYFACITGVDAQIGRLLAVLDRTELAENTVVVFTSDHGELMGSHGLMHKTEIFDESLLVPLIVRGPGVEPQLGDDALISVPDLCPTLLSLAGHADRIPPGLAGRDLSPAFRGEPMDRPDCALFIRRLAHTGGPDQLGLRTERWSFVLDRLNGHTTRAQLFDNREDPYQLADRAAELPDVVAQLTDRLRTELERTGQDRTDRA